MSRILAEYRALWQLAVPMGIAQLAQVGMGVVNTLMIGHYSATDLAAVAIGVNIWLPLSLIVLGVMLGATTLVALKKNADFPAAALIGGLQRYPADQIKAYALAQQPQSQGASQ